MNIDNVRILRKECETIVRTLKEIEKKKNPSKHDKNKMKGRLTANMGGVFYGMCLFIDDGTVTEEKIEKAAKTKRDFP